MQTTVVEPVKAVVLGLWRKQLYLSLTVLLSSNSHSHPDATMQLSAGGEDRGCGEERKVKERQRRGVETWRREEVRIK